MTQPLNGKVIIVTGAAGGIGQACAVKLAEAGARLLLTDIVNCDATIAAIRRSEKNAIFVKADVGVESDAIPNASEYVASKQARLRGLPDRSAGCGECSVFVASLECRTDR
jgi:NAD(P)-dependent dehydrogenase (short-subunit alcohol dehydrogenase family)